MKKLLVCAMGLMLLAGCDGADKTHSVQLMYNNDIGYTWYLDNANELKMAELVSETKTPGAFMETKLGNPYTQTFRFKLRDKSISTEKLVFKYKHELEKDTNVSEAVREFNITPSDFK